MGGKNTLTSILHKTKKGVPVIDTPFLYPFSLLRSFSDFIRSYSERSITI